MKKIVSHRHQKCLLQPPNDYLSWSSFDIRIFFLLQLDREGEDTYQASGSANIILYVGLGMICIGLVITFVGLGDKGFRTLELKLIGPSLVGCGLFFALLRILFCTIPSCCRGCCKCCRKEEDTEELIYATVSPDPDPEPVKID
jgi:hypothetical protein